MFASSIPQPFSGMPLTTQSKDKDGNPIFTVQARALNVFGAKLAHRLGLLSGFVMAVGEAWWLATTLPPLATFGWLVVAAAPFVTPVIVKFGLSEVLKVERVIRIDVKEVKLRTFFGWKSYSLDVPTRFSLIDHDREKIESERLEFIKRKWGKRWWFPQPRAYLNKASHLSLDHFDQRNDVMTVFGKAKARVIQARLNACLDVVRNHGRAGQGTSFEATGDWSAQPGAITELS